MAIRINVKYRTQVIQYALAFGIVCLIGLVFYPLSTHIGFRVVSFVLLFALSIMATFMGTGPMVMASAMCALIWDYFFIPPTHTFQIGRPEDSLMLGMFFFIAIVNGILTSRIKRQERLTRDREERTNALFELSKDLSHATGLEDVIRVASSHLKRNFNSDVTFLLQDSKGNLTHTFSVTHILKKEFICALESYKKGIITGKHTAELSNSEYTFFPLAGTSLKPGVAMAKLNEWFTGYKELQWNTCLAQISAAIEREFLDESAQNAKILLESDKLYKTLFNTISHELKIPVATIMGAADTLLNPGHTEEVRNELNREIFKASERLNRLIENLLNMSRLETGRLTPHMDWCDVYDLVNRVTDNLKSELESFHLIVSISENMPLVKLDYGMMESVLYNLVYNACLYAEKNTNIRIKIHYEGGNFMLEVLDRGPGFPKKSLPFVFDKFYRVAGSKAGGTGLGLSIVKGFVEAQKGIVMVENRKNGGARFILKIPSEIHKMEKIS